ncbi:hypothetical protein KUV50_06740 [Membranicola marinus]|uniref:Uncharacterized protein n=1 Tax=Membranihabitans marinus TaxID=1227546 RepID=A0A953HNI3_9BACT|nr:hypothetical protein [Membranihabitans marinus]MBY5957818.1 hypothetical protein [Membranihabitans marinus]
MFQWLFIGLVIWYFYNRFKKRNERRYRQDHRYIRDDDFNHQRRQPPPRAQEEDDYIDYEEVK